MSIDEQIANLPNLEYPLHEVRGHKFSGVRAPELYKAIHGMTTVHSKALLTITLLYMLIIVAIDLFIQEHQVRSRLSLVAHPVLIMGTFSLYQVYNFRRTQAKIPAIDPVSLIQKPTSATGAPYPASITLFHGRLLRGLEDTGWIFFDGELLKFYGLYSCFCLNRRTISHLKQSQHVQTLILTPINGLSQIRLDVCASSLAMLRTLEHREQAASSELDDPIVILPAVLSLPPNLEDYNPWKFFGLASLTMMVIGSALVIGARLRHGPNAQNTTDALKVFGSFTIVAIVAILITCATQSFHLRILKKFAIDPEPT